MSLNVVYVQKIFPFMVRWDVRNITKMSFMYDVSRIGYIEHTYINDNLFIYLYMHCMGEEKTNVIYFILFYSC